MPRTPLSLLLGLLLAPLPLQAELTLVSCEPEKVYYEPGETVKITVMAKNNGAEKVAGRLRVSVAWDAVNRKELMTESLALEPGADLQKTIEWTPQEELWGCEAIAESFAPDGRVASRKSETFAVHHTPFAVGQGMALRAARTIPGQGFVADNYGTWPVEELMRTARRYYVTWSEQGWAPSDFCSLTPKEETWWASWGYYPESKAGIKEVIKQGHRHGIRCTMYTWCGAEGLPGMEFARQHPEWVQRTELGQFVGRYDQRSLEVVMPAITSEEARNDFMSSSFVSYVQMDAYDPASIDFAAGELVRAIEMFGWDGVRFDGHWTLDGISFDNQATYGYEGTPQSHGKDPDQLSLRNMRCGVEIIHQRFPKFLFGYNYGFDYQNMGAHLPKTFDFCAKDSLIGWESSRCMHREGDPYHTWEAALDAFRREVDITRKAGGYEHVISPDPYFPPGFARHYLPALYASGAHLWYVQLTNELSKKNYGFSTEEAIPIHRFAMRYSRFVYDRSIRHGIPPGCDLRVEGEGLWRNNLVTTQPGDRPNERFIVCQILGKRAKEVVDVSDRAEPVPVTKCQAYLVIPATMKILTVTWLCPEKEPVTVEFKPGGSQQSAILPDTPYWSMLVVKVNKNG